VDFALDWDFDLDSARDRERGRSSLLVVGKGGAAARGGDDNVRSIGVWDAERFRLSGMGIGDYYAGQ
jgi:hypothetical protein